MHSRRHRLTRLALVWCILASCCLVGGSVSYAKGADRSRGDLKPATPEPVEGRRGQRPWEVDPLGEGDAVKKRPGGMLLKADAISTRIEPDGKTRVILGIGNVRIESDEFKLEADNLVLWAQQAPGMADVLAGRAKNVQLYAEGNVIVDREETRVWSERIFHDIGMQKSLVYQGRVRVLLTEDKVPVYIRAEKMRRTRKDWGWEHASITTSSFGKPPYEVYAGTIDMKKRPGTDRVTVRDSTVRIGDIPVFYFPKMTRSWKGSMLRSVRFEGSSQFGTGIMTDWSLMDGGWYEVLMQLDYLSDRGIGVGVDIEYKLPGIVGVLDTYFISDRRGDDLTEEREKEGTDIGGMDKQRYRVRWQHRQDLGQGWMAIAEYSYLSDPDFLNEFFEDEAREGKEQESVLYLRKLYENFGMTFLVKWRTNDWMTQTEYLPQFAAHLIAEPFVKNRVYLDSDVQFAYVRRKPPEGEEVEGVEDIEDKYEARGVDTGTSGGPGNIRFDWNNRVYVPLKTGIFKINPFVGVRMTAYSKTRSGGGFRFAPEGGVSISTDMWRVYGVHSDLLNIHGLRHIVNPGITYFNRFNTTLDPEDTYFYDEVDDIDTESWFEFSIHHLFQTKRMQWRSPSPKLYSPLAYGRRYLGLDDVREELTGEQKGQPRIVDIAEIDLAFRIYPDSEDSPTDEHMGNVFTEVRLYPMEGVSVFWDSQWNVNDFQVESATMGVAVGFSERWSGLVSYRYHVEENANITFEVNYIFNEKYNASLLYSFNFDLRDEDEIEGDEFEDDSKVRDFELVLRRHFHTWLFELSLSSDQGDSGGTNNSVGLQVRPMGLVSRRATFAGEGRTRMGSRRAFSKWE